MQRGDETQPSETQPVVETRSGPVAGEHKRGAWRWKGIPFAAPPVGELRFRPPQPAHPWTDVRDATGRFPIAPQPMAGMEAAAGGAGGAAQSEDCLTLNVWTPAADDGRRPVLFWVHGGAFVTGAGTVPWYDGGNLTRRDIVVVTTNYRLGALGFLELGGIDASYADSGNCGLMDQIAALEWVRDNIAAFGGDPDNVTLAGESAGAYSVGALLGSPAAQGLFHKAIPQSGAAGNVSEPAWAEESTAKFLAALGVDDTAGLQAASVDDVLRAQNTVAAGFGSERGLRFQPVAGGPTLPRQPLAAVRDGMSAYVPLLTGSNKDEMRLFTALDPGMAPTHRESVLTLADTATGGNGAALLAHHEAAGVTDPKGLYEAIATDFVFRMPALDLLEAQAPHAPTYGYEFHFESSAFGGALGAAHAVEIPFMFDNLDAGGASFFVGEPTQAMRELATRMADAWCAFAHSGRPGAGGLPEWPRHDSDGRPTMILDLEPHVELDPAADVRALWSATS